MLARMIFAKKKVATQIQNTIRATQTRQIQKQLHIFIFSRHIRREMPNGFHRKILWTVGPIWNGREFFLQCWFFWRKRRSQHHAIRACCRRKRLLIHDINKCRETNANVWNNIVSRSIWYCLVYVNEYIVYWSESGNVVDNMRREKRRAKKTWNELKRELFCCFWKDWYWFHNDANKTKWNEKKKLS